MGEKLVDNERFTMVFIIGRIVAETCFWSKMKIRSRSHCLIEYAGKL